MVGPHRDRGDRNDRPVVGPGDLELPHQPRQHQCRLGQRELRADADARADAERQIGEAVGRRRAGQKARRVEHIRLGPEPPVAVQKPRRDHHDGAFRYRDAIRFVGGARDAEDAVGRRVEAQCFLHDGAGVGQVRQGFSGALGAEVERCRLGRDALLHIRRRRQQIERPEQCHRGRRMAGGDHRRDLVGEPPARHLPAGFRIGRHQIQQIARRPGTDPGLAGGDDLVDQPEPMAAKAPARDVLGSRQPGRQQDVERRGPGETLAVVAQHFAHARREGVHLEREHRAAGDLDRETVHVIEQIDFAVLGSEGRGQLVGDPGDVARQHRQGARREGRRDGAALLAPILALGEEQAAADDRVEEPHGRRAAAVILGIVDQHVADRAGAVQGQLLAAEQAARQHLVFEGALGEGGQHVLPHAGGEFARRQDVPAGQGRREARQRSVSHSRGRRNHGAASNDTSVNAPSNSHASLSAIVSPACSTSGATRSRVASSTGPIG